MLCVIVVCAFFWVFIFFLLLFFFCVVLCAHELFVGKKVYIAVVLVL